LRDRDRWSLNGPLCRGLRSMITARFTDARNDNIRRAVVMVHGRTERRPLHTTVTAALSRALATPSRSPALHRLQRHAEANEVG
jgi:hypothetical protein